MRFRPGPTAWILSLVLTALVAGGVLRLRLDVDVFGLLPSGSPMVEGLRLYQQSFAATRGLVVSLRSPDAATTESAARSLAEELARSGLTPHVVWQNPLTEDVDSLAEILAYLWLNRPPEELAALLDRFGDEGIPLRLESTLERMATSIRPQEVGRLARDPFSLTEVGDRLDASLGPDTDDPFASADGSFRLLFVLLPSEKPSFWEYRAWMARLRDRLGEWQRGRADAGELTVRFTGNPAFVVETGSGLLNDGKGAGLGTLALVAGLFWLVHRRWTPLLWLVALLVFVLAATAALGGLFLGRTLNAMSLGFAAILLGLAADYALILYQELVAHPERSLVEHRTTMAPSILWAAFTTAGAFFMIGRSSLPGLNELGTLVAIGTVVAASVMLVAFLPPLVGRMRYTAPERAKTGILSLTPRTAAWLTLLAAAAALVALGRGLPAVDRDTEQLGSRGGLARDALEELRREVGGFDDAMWVLVGGEDEDEVAARLGRVRSILEEAVEEELLEGFLLPDELWPRPRLQAANRETLRRLAGRRETARQAALEAGFTDGALRLTDGVFSAWERFAGAGTVIWPERPGAEWTFSQFAAREVSVRDGEAARFLALGSLRAAPEVNKTALRELAARIHAEERGRLFSWSLLSDSLLGLMKRDVTRVVLPMGAVLLLLLGLAFRRPREVVLSLVTLGFSLVCLLGAMSVLGWSWNLMNVMSLPLLFGAGVDYSIHIQLALQRYRGDVVQVRHTVGKAILLCGASTAAGFGTLAFASNAGLASLGRVCAAGIILTSLISVLLLPAWWRAVERHSESRTT